MVRVRFRPQPFQWAGAALAIGLVVAGHTAWILLVAILCAISIEYRDES